MIPTSAFKGVSLLGQRFGRLVVEAFDGQRGAQWTYYWACKCDCGRSKSVAGGNLKRGLIRSCGCLRAEKCSERAKRVCRTHGLSQRGISRSWYGMKARCENPLDPNYGGRGIRICSRWQSIANFIEDMEPSYRPGLTIERIDNDGNYEPGNCRWATGTEQANNKRTSLFLKLGTVTKTVAQWCASLGIKPAAVYRRLAKGMSPEEALGISHRQ